MVINTCAKRGKAKVKCDLTLKDFYEVYKGREEAKERKPKDYKLYRDIIKDFNEELVRTIVFDNEVVKLPYRLGNLSIKKYKVSFNPDKQNIWKVDYKKSKEVGFIVYYDSPYRYKWKWNKRHVKLTGKKYYKFLPCREASRLIAKALRENSRLDYFTVNR